MSGPAFFLAASGVYCALLAAWLQRPGVLVSMRSRCEELQPPARCKGFLLPDSFMPLLGIRGGNSHHVHPCYRHHLRSN